LFRASTSYEVCEREDGDQCEHALRAFVWPRQWSPVAARGKNSRAAKILFIIFVDAIFTTLLERLFTKVFDVIKQTPAMACVYPARTTD
jgi:hypothetical protein